MNTEAILNSLEIMWKGMTAIFIVLLTIYLSVVLILKIKPKN